MWKMDQEVKRTINRKKGRGQQFGGWGKMSSNCTSFALRSPKDNQFEMAGKYGVRYT